MDRDLGEIGEGSADEGALVIEVVQEAGGVVAADVELGGGESEAADADALQGDGAAGDDPDAGRRDGEVVDRGAGAAGGGEVVQDERGALEHGGEVAVLGGGRRATSRAARREGRGVGGEEVRVGVHG